MNVLLALSNTGRNFCVWDERYLKCKLPSLQCGVIQSKGQGQVIVRTMRVYRGNRHVATLSLNLDTRWRDLHAVAALSPEKRPEPLIRRLGGCQSEPQHFG
jgi:hypothetical protein